MTWDCKICGGKVDLSNPTQPNVNFTGRGMHRDRYKKKEVMFNRIVVEPAPAGSKKIWQSVKVLDGPVRIMAQSEGYCMVRRKGGMPFVIATKDIQEGSDQ
jgi:hypothetical protein